MFTLRSAGRATRLRRRLSVGSLDVAARCLNDEPHRHLAPLPRYPSSRGEVPVEEACVHHRRHQAGVPRGRRGDRACSRATSLGCRARRPCSPAPVLGPRARRYGLGCDARGCEHKQGMRQLCTTPMQYRLASVGRHWTLTTVLSSELIRTVDIFAFLGRLPLRSTPCRPCCACPAADLPARRDQRSGAVWLKCSSSASARRVARGAPASGNVACDGPHSRARASRAVPVGAQRATSHACAACVTPSRALAYPGRRHSAVTSEKEHSARLQRRRCVSAAVKRSQSGAGCSRRLCSAGGRDRGAFLPSHDRATQLQVGCLTAGSVCACASPQRALKHANPSGDCSSAHGRAQKMYNWTTLNQKARASVG